MDINIGYKMKNEYSEIRLFRLYVVFSSLNYSSRNMQTDAILSSARSCHVHCHHVKLHVCRFVGGWGWRGGAERSGACINVTRTQSLKSKIPYKLQNEA